MKTSLFAAVSCVALMAFAANAAETGIDPSQVKGKITFYTHFTNFIKDGSFDKWVAEFKAAYPAVEEVEVIGVTAYTKDMPTRMAGGDYGDVLNILDAVPPGDYKLYYEPLDDLDMAKDFNFAERYQVEGKYYGFTYGMGAEAVVVKKTAFKKAGIETYPKTRDEFFAACAKLKEAGITPMLINMGAGWPMAQWDKQPMAIAEDGGYYEKMLTDPAPFSLDKPYGKTLAFVKELKDKGCIEKDYTANNWEASKGWMAADKAAMWFFANWSINQIVEAGAALNITVKPEDIGFFPLPMDNSGVGKVVLNPDYALAVAANSKNKPTAKAFVKFFLTKTNVSNRAGFIPGDKNMKATLPQLVELESFNPKYIRTETPSTAFKEAMSTARFDFMTGTYLRDAILAKDFDGALRNLNKQWAAAIKK
jgi:raffinose/stachyose/melibiose transport system substrate-binding protein